MSLGFLIPEESPVVWRGLMVCKDDFFFCINICYINNDNPFAQGNESPTTVDSPSTLGTIGRACD